MGEVYMDSDHYIFIPHGDKFSIWLTPPQAKWTNPGRHRGLAEEPKEVYLFHFSAILYTIFCSLFKVREWVEGQCGKEKLLANKEDDSIWEAPGLESFFFFFLTTNTITSNPPAWEQHLFREPIRTAALKKWLFLENWKMVYFHWLLWKGFHGIGLGGCVLWGGLD